MHYKIEGAIKRNRIPFIISVILWLFLTIVFVVPFCYAFYAASLRGPFDLNTFLDMFGKAVFKPFSAFGALAGRGQIGLILKTELGFTLFYAIVFFIGFTKSAPKNQYSDIEHGSSDWSKRGEQYQILNKNEGIILGEDNYLPTDKRGNVNVLVVGRIRFW